MLIKTNNLKEIIVSKFSSIAPVYFEEDFDNLDEKIVYYFLLHEALFKGDNSYSKDKKRVVVNVEIYTKQGDLNLLKDDLENTFITEFKAILRKEEDIRELDEFLGYRFEFEFVYQRVYN